MNIQYFIIFDSDSTTLAVWIAFHWLLKNSLFFDWFFVIG